MELNGVSKVQVLMSTYNGSKYIADQIKSIICNGFSNIHLNIRDDGSSDKATLESLNNFINCNNITVNFEENVGVIRSFYNLLQRSNDSYDYYAFSDQDDIWKNGKIARAVETLKKMDKNKPILYCTNIEIVDANLKHLSFSKVKSPRPSFENALVENIVTGCTMVINRRAKDLLLGHFPRHTLMHDWWAYLVISCFGKVIYDSHPTILYRQHDSNVVGYTSNIFADFVKRVRSFLKRGSERKLQKQAEEFYNFYNNSIDEKKLKVLKLFIKDRKNLLNRIKYAYKSPIYRNNLLDNIILKILIILNRV